MSQLQVENAARQALGSVPSSWHIDKIDERLMMLKPMCQQSVIKLDPMLKPPPSTYLLWLVREKGISFAFYQNSVLNEENISLFESKYQEMAEEAKLTAELDISNFWAEQSISTKEQILKKSVMSISSVYRYIAAQENSLEFVLTDEVILKAIKELRANPWLFFCYGEAAMSLMPVLWGDL